MFAEKTMEASATTGTGSYQLGTPVGAFKTWRSQFANLSPVFYCAENGDGTIWEIGYGTLAYGSPDTISRSVLASSTGSAISWAVADAPVYVFSAPLATWMKHLALGGVAAAVPAWLPDGGIWSSSADGIAVRLKETIKHGAVFAERGRYEGVPGIWVSSPRSYFVDNGAAGLTLTADMIGRGLPVTVAISTNAALWAHPRSRLSVETLRAWGITVVEPVEANGERTLAPIGEISSSVAARIA